MLLLSHHRSRMLGSQMVDQSRLLWAVSCSCNSLRLTSDLSAAQERKAQLSQRSSANLPTQRRSPDQQRDSGRQQGSALGAVSSASKTRDRRWACWGSPQLSSAVVQIGGIGGCVRIRLVCFALHIAASMSRNGGEPTESSS